MNYIKNKQGTYLGESFEKLLCILIVLAGSCTVSIKIVKKRPDLTQLSLLEPAAVSSLTNVTIWNDLLNVTRGAQKVAR
jgi:hypothetical protein